MKSRTIPTPFLSITVHKLTGDYLERGGPQPEVHLSDGPVAPHAPKSYAKPSRVASNEESLVLGDAASAKRRAKLQDERASVRATLGHTAASTHRCASRAPVCTPLHEESAMNTLEVLLSAQSEQHTRKHRGKDHA